MERRVLVLFQNKKKQFESEKRGPCESLLSCLSQGRTQNVCVQRRPSTFPVSAHYVSAL